MAAVRIIIPWQARNRRAGDGTANSEIQARSLALATLASPARWAAGSFVVWLSATEALGIVAAAARFTEAKSFQPIESASWLTKKNRQPRSWRGGPRPSAVTSHRR